MSCECNEFWLCEEGQRLWNEYANAKTDEELEIARNAYFRHISEPDAHVLFISLLIRRDASDELVLIRNRFG